MGFKYVPIKTQDFENIIVREHNVQGKGGALILSLEKSRRDCVIKAFCGDPFYNVWHKICTGTPIGFIARS